MRACLGIKEEALAERLLRSEAGLPDLRFDGLSGDLRAKDKMEWRRETRGMGLSPMFSSTLAPERKVRDAESIVDAMKNKNGWIRECCQRVALG